MFYPIFLNLNRKQAVVIGGGDVAERKTVLLLDCSAVVTVISPQVTPRLESMAHANQITLKKRHYETGDCAAAFLVFAATNNLELNRTVWNDAQQAGALVNTVDDAEFCDFIAPSVVTRGDLTIAISTNSKSPALAAHLRRRTLHLIGPEYGELLDLLSEIRAEIRKTVSGADRRKELHYKIIESGVLQFLRNGDRTGARQLMRRTVEDYVRSELPSR